MDGTREYTLLKWKNVVSVKNMSVLYIFSKAIIMWSEHLLVKLILDPTTTVNKTLSISDNQLLAQLSNFTQDYIFYIVKQRNVFYCNNVY